ncbi:uncharacterized protein CCR75_004662 [Bremia lactucae]|uniref:NadR/Ttd14 AAA domain-containing protein n=1 Tax=Bremia lactucae TaxID=4779 RepID=A0A976IGP8_BRELC|nr:hypothetical protein CCR75_004662 [Bremia lactucae]
MKPAPDVIIVALEGCHGCGKTTLCNAFAAQGYDILDEGFLDMASYSLHPQSLLMETSWVCSWFTRVLRIAEHATPGRKRIYIADRSPFSSVLYSAHGHLLEPVIREQMREVQDFTNVQIYTVLVQVEPERLWRRICTRLKQEPKRLHLKERNRDWMEETIAFYDNFKWDLTVTTNEDSVDTIVTRISRLISAPCERTLPCRKIRHSPSVSSTLSTDSECDSAEEEHHVPVASR